MAFPLFFPPVGVHPAVAPGFPAPFAPQPAPTLPFSLIKAPELAPAGGADVQPPAPVENAATQPVSLGARLAQTMQDPAAQLALLAFGTKMLQPIQPGQTAIGNFGEAVNQGVGALLTQQQREQEAQLKNRELGQIDTRLGQGQQQVDVEKQRAGYEGQRTNAEVGLQGSQQKAIDQKIQQNEQMFPKTLAQIDKKLQLMVSQGKLDDAQAELLKQKARLYPTQINADLARAEAAKTEATAAQTRAGAAVTAANKASPQENLFSITAKAMVDSGEAPDLATAQALLGRSLFDKTQTGAGVQTINRYEQSWAASNPPKPGETPQQYQQRKAAAVQKFMTTAKSPDIVSSFTKFLSQNGAFYLQKGEDGQTHIDTQRAYQDFLSGQQAAGGGTPTTPQTPQTPAAPAGKGAKPKADFHAGSGIKPDLSKYKVGDKITYEKDGKVYTLEWNGTKFVLAR